MLAVPRDRTGRLVATVYRRALRNAGLDVATRTGLDDRAALDRAFADATVDIAIDHIDDALLDTTRLPVPQAAATGDSSDATTTRAGSSRRRSTTSMARLPAAGSLGSAAIAVTVLNERLASRARTALLPSSSGHQRALAVRAADAQRDDLAKVSDLRRTARRLVLGGQGGCVDDDTSCARQLREVYGLRFRELWEVSDDGAMAALAAGEVDVAWVESDSPEIAANGLTLLVDDRRMITAGNLVPIVRDAVLDPELRAVTDTVSAALSPETMTELVALAAEKKSAEKAASAWLDKQGIGAPPS